MDKRLMSELTPNALLLRIGIVVFSDILLNPVFTEEGFNEEMEVIKQELKEWDEDIEQYTEDKLYYNCMEKSKKE